MGLLDRRGASRWREALWRDVAGPRVLEVGVGTGLNLSHYPPDVHVTAVDPASWMLCHARRRAAGNRSVTFVQGRVEDLSFGSGSFDDAVASFLFCSVDDPGHGIRELYRVLRPGGSLFLLEHCRSRGPWGRMMDLISGPIYRLTGDHIARDMAIETAQAGFVDVSSTHVFLDVVRLIRARRPICSRAPTVGLLSVDGRKVKSMISISELMPVHRAQVASMVRSMDRFFYHRDMEGALEAVDRVLSGQRRHSNFFVALDGDQVIGLIGFRERLDTDRIFYLSFFAVTDGYRGQGVGRRLLETVEKALTGKARLLIAESSPAGYAAPARRFYENHGFALVATVEDYWQDGDALAVFQKRPDSPRDA